MAFTKGPVVEVPLKQHPGILRYATNWESDGLSNVWMDFSLQNLGTNVIDGKVVVRNAQGAIVGQHTAGIPPNEFGNINLHVIVPAGIAQSTYGEWTADITIRVNNSTISTFGWEYDGRYIFHITYTAAPPPPPPPPDPCANCGPGTTCQNGTCVPIPPPPPVQPSLMDRLIAIFPDPLKPYAIPISLGASWLLLKGIAK